MTETMRQGDTMQVGPTDEFFITWNWDTFRGVYVIPAAASISTSTWTVTVLKQNGDTPLTVDNDSIPTSRTTRVRIVVTGASDGDLYKVTNTIVTNESPTQTFARSSKVLVTSEVVDQ